MKEYRENMNGDGKPSISKERWNLKKMGSIGWSNRSGKEYAEACGDGTAGMNAPSATKQMGKNPMTGGHGKEYRQETMKG